MGCTPKEMPAHIVGVAPNGPAVSNFTYVESSARSHSNAQTYVSCQTDRYLQPCIPKYTGHSGPCWDSRAKVIARLRERSVYPAHAFKQSSIPMWLEWFLPLRNERCRPAMAG